MTKNTVNYSPRNLRVLCVSAVQFFISLGVVLGVLGVLAVPSLIISPTPLVRIRLAVYNGSRLTRREVIAVDEPNRRDVVRLTSLASCAG